MNTKKIAGIASFIAVLACVNFANAADHWTPLVRIPGLPATGHVDLSMYLVGLYNFLLSIVGIVAVMMLIIGGMRYITAAGNSAAISDAKDIVSNAIIGLLLALLSWVFIATINPDVLYIKQPGSGFNVTDVHGSCHKSYDPVTSTCICIDTVDISPRADRTACNDDCYDLDHCKLPDSYPCIATGSPNDFTDKTFDQFPYNGRCHCIDDAYVEPHWVNIDATPGTETCNDVCYTVAFAGDLSYHCLVADLKVGIDPNVPLMSIDEIAKYAVYDSPKEDPIEIAQGAVFVCNGETSISGNPVLWWDFDADIDAAKIFEIAIPGAASPYLFFAYTYAGLVANPRCTTSLMPTAVICPIQFRVRDNAGNARQDVVYVKILAP